jgi:hypothetical protein
MTEELERLQLELTAAKLKIIEFENEIERRNRIGKKIESHLTDLSLLLTHYRFDLEATRRERDYFKNLGSKK